VFQGEAVYIMFLCSVLQCAKVTCNRNISPIVRYTLSDYTIMNSRVMSRLELGVNPPLGARFNVESQS
jgi:hypothetical protein